MKYLQLIIVLSGVLVLPVSSGCKRKQPQTPPSVAAAGRFLSSCRSRRAGRIPRLQALPPGQMEAAKALGLSPIQSITLIILPQALRLVIPALVGQFITMFKDTSLVVLVGLLDLLGTAQSILAKPEYSEHRREVLVFAAIIYFVFSYSMSRTARYLERTGSGKHSQIK